MPDTLVAITANDTLWFKAGTSWSYDNSGYVVLGMLVEKLAGRAWGIDLSERLAKPLGLGDTRNCLTQPIIPRRANGYANENGQWVNAPFLAMSQPYAAGAMCSTVGDLARWNRVLATGQVVSAASYANMTTPEGAAVKSKYGYGLVRDTLAGRTVVTHGGGINGFISANAWFPDVELSVTVLSNSGAARSDRLMALLARAALGAPLIRPPARVAITAEDRARYVGVYALVLGGSPRDFTISERDGELYSQLEGQGAIVLIPLGNHAFGASFDPSVRIVFTVEHGNATMMTLMQGGQSFDGRRK